MVFMLIHSPLVGPFIWSLVAEELRARDREVIVPTLSDAEDSATPYWQQYTAIVAHRLTAVPRDRSVHWIGHSGAGPLLPALRQAVPHPVASYVFVDAGIHATAPVTSTCLRRSSGPSRCIAADVAGRGALPNWNEAMLHPLIPDPKRL